MFAFRNLVHYRNFYTNLHFVVSSSDSFDYKSICIDRILLEIQTKLQESDCKMGNVYMYNRERNVTARVNTC